MVGKKEIQTLNFLTRKKRGSRAAGYRELTSTALNCGNGYERIPNCPLGYRIAEKMPRRRVYCPEQIVGTLQGYPATMQLITSGPIRNGCVEFEFCVVRREEATPIPSSAIES